MQKIGFVIPWYGEDIPGGEELKLRELAAYLQHSGMEIEILTTCVRDHTADWNENYYAVGTAVVDDITVRRFPVRRRDAETFSLLHRRLSQGIRLSVQEERVYAEEMLNSPQLYDYLEAAKSEYSLYVFLPYSFATTFYGMQICPEKSVLIPCFYDEPAAYLRMFRQTYIQARGIIYHSLPERELAGKIYDFSSTAQTCIGIGMNPTISGDGDFFRRAYGIDAPFLLYAGRKTESKNVPLLLRYFTEYKRRIQDDLKLVLIGSGRVEIPSEIAGEVYDLGYVTEEDKYHAMAAAVLLCQPSKRESFSQVMMESWLCGRPVLVHSGCAVTREFVKAAGGGLYFRDYFEFEGCVNYIRSQKEQAAIMGENGKLFVQSHFAWDTVVEQYQTFFQKLTEE